MSWELDSDHREFQAVCRSFVDREVRPLVEQAEAAGTFPAQLWKTLGAAGLLGLVTPAEQGGGDGDGLAVALLAEELARASGGIAVTALVSAYMAAPHIVRHGSPAQQERWLRPLATGEAVASIAVTEPGTGSDVARVSPRPRAARTTATSSTAARCSSRTPGWPTLLIVAARTGDDGRGGVTLFLVETLDAGDLVRPTAGARWAGTPPTPAK